MTDSDFIAARRRDARRASATRSTPRSPPATPTSTGASTTASSRSSAEDGGKLIVNRHVPNREIWVAARSGGFHFRAAGRRAGATRAAARSSARRSRGCVHEQSGWRSRVPLLPASRVSARATHAASSAVQSSSARRSAAWPGQQPLDDRPEARRVVELDQVRDLVRDDVVGERGRQLDEAPVEADLAAALQLPHSLRAFESRTGGAARAERAPRSAATRGRHSAQRLVAQPVRRRAAATCAPRPARAGCSTVRSKRSARTSGLRRREHRQRELAALVEDRRAGLPHARQHLAAPLAPLGQRAHDPAAALAQRALDLGERHPARRAHREAVEVDLHADRAPARADQPVVDVLALQATAVASRRSRRLRSRARVTSPLPSRPPAAPRAAGSPSRSTSASIHASTSRVSAAGSLPRASIGAPIDSVTVPGRLPNTPFGHSQPALCAIGSTRRVHRQREARAARLVLRAAARADARALGIDHDPEALAEALAALLDDLLHRVLAAPAVDRDRRGEAERPAEERDRQQLLLRDVGHRRAELGEEERLPGRAVLAQDHVRRRRPVLEADHPVADAADHARGPQVDLAPVGDEAEARLRRQPAEAEHRDRVGRGDDELEQREGERAHRGGGALERRTPAGARPYSLASSADTAKARSGKITVFLRERAFAQRAARPCRSARASAARPPPPPPAGRAGRRR